MTVSPTFEMLRPLATKFAEDCAQYSIAAAEAAEQHANGSQPIKTWLATITPDTNYVDPTLNEFIDDFAQNATSPAQLLAMRNALKAALDNVDDLLETHFVVERKQNQTDIPDLSEFHANLKSQFKGFRGFLDSGLITLNDLASVGVPVEMVKKGRALEPQPTLNIPRAPRTAVRLRANSKQIKLVIDGNVPEQINLSDGILRHLNMSWAQFRTAFGEFEEGKEIEINGHQITLVFEDAN